MPPLRNHCRSPRLRLPGAVALWLLLLVSAGLWGAAPVAAATSASPAKKSSKSSSNKKTSKSTSKKKVTPRAPVRPVSRDAGGPLDLTSSEEHEEHEGDSEEDSEDETSGDPEAELEAIERELLAHPVELEPAFLQLETLAREAPRDRGPQWITHKIIPGEQAADIAERYGVQRKELAVWNHLKGDKPKLTPGKTLRVKAVNPPPQRERHQHVVQKGETWESLAKQHELEVAQLRSWNRAFSKRSLKPRDKLVFWREPPPPGTGLASKLAQIRVPAGGVSIGKATRGRLVRGVELPERPDLYTRRKPETSHGSSHTITQILAAVTRFRHETGFTRSVVISGISRPSGGRFHPHRSHQSGRDIDIRMPLTAAGEGKKHVTSSDIDWRATWKLIQAFLVGGEVEYIFVEHSLQKRLYTAARESGVSREELARWLQWPNRPKTNKGVVRHAQGHTVHFHVRIRCAATEKHCVTTR